MSGVSKPEAGVPLDPPAQDEAFWVTLPGSDKRLAKLRRAIDEAAGEAMARETGAGASPSPNSHLGESRYETARRKITEALKAEGVMTSAAEIGGDKSV